MTPDDRRRLGAVAALVLGLFVAVSLLELRLTGPLGSAVGSALKGALGLGAIGLPLLGLGVALAGFQRLPLLDMKRVALLMGGLSLLAPFFVAVFAGVTRESYTAAAGDPSVSARLAGIIPGFLAAGAVSLVGKIGGVLLGFLALSGLTLGTIAWHPLRRLERGTAGAATRSSRTARTRAPRLAEDDGAPEDDGSLELAPRPSPASATAGRAERRPEREKPARRATPGSQPAGGTEAAALPPLELLAPPAESDEAADQAQLEHMGKKLLEALQTFKLDGTISGWTSGPVVTQFEVVPASGVKVGRIIALSDDLAIKLRTPSVRVAPIPGKGAVGVEIPNPTARMVGVRELIESPEWERARSRAVLPLPLGKDLEGRPVITDLAKTPHLLIAGATGSGKSVTINAIITGLVYRYTPKELRLLMIDPKMVELSMYNALPHMRHPVVTDNHDAASVLKYAKHEMGRRYELLHANGARNIADFNRKVHEGRPMRMPAPAPVTLQSINDEPPDTPPSPPPDQPYSDGILPYLVIIVDELADLMMTVQGEVETPLALLAQKARAIGIHLVLATQRPSVNVITGLIKANFPSRVAFRVASKVDSRTILDQNGAEALLGNGDMLFLPPGKSEPMRLQGAFIGTDETERLMAWYDAERKAREAPEAPVEPDILELVRAQEAAESGEEGPSPDQGDRDLLFKRAAEVCIQNMGGSTSLLQRRLSIGYGRAARIMDQLQMAGILGPSEGSKGREVLIGIDQLDEYAGD